MLKIPFVDLAWQHQVVADDVRTALDSLMSTSAYILGPQVHDFEEEFAEYCGVEYCIGVANGTEALTLAMRALHIGPNDEVLVPTNSFIASASAVLAAGASPVFVDVEEESFLIDLTSAEAALTEHTKAIMPVHLYGRLVNPTEVQDFAEKHGLLIIEDAAQAHGAAFDGERIGARSKVAATSFYPGKNLGAYGDAGAVLTNDLELAEKVRMLRDHGSPKKYVHEILGYNSRLDAIQAAVLRIKLRHLDEWNAHRQHAAAYYYELLASEERVRRPLPAGSENVWHIYPLRVDAAARDTILRTMETDGVGVGIHYPIPIHQQPAMVSTTKTTVSLRVSEAIAPELLSLPIFPGITEQQQDFVVASLRNAL